MNLPRSTSRARHRRSGFQPALGAFTLLLMLLCPGASPGQNFRGADPEILHAAEEARRNSAEFWSGAPLPGEWSAPCPIVVRGGRSGSGMTRFTFENGEVFGWTMTVNGPRTSILQDVIPHEVDHMVRASLLRRPIERWLDEGCASLMESAAVHERLRRSAQRVDPKIISRDWLSGRRYPDSGAELGALYAVGFSLVEFLLERADPQALLEFQRDAAPIDVRLRGHYGLTVETLRASWSAWRDDQHRRGPDCGAAGCARHTLHPQQPDCHCSDPPGPLLLIWTASWCGPCRSFWNDWQQHAEFREALTSRFHIHVLDLDRHRQLATRRGVSTVPTFEWDGGRISGYSGTSELLERLGTAGDAERESVQPAEEPDRGDAPAASPPPPLTTAPAPASREREAEGDARERQPAEPGGSTSLPPEPLRSLTLGLSWLERLGLIGGSFAGGGIGGAALSSLLMIRRQRRRRQRHAAEERGEKAHARVPFPRELDEAGQLLGLRRSEGRVAVLDALRGMFLDDELDKLVKQSDPAAAEFADALRRTIDSRVEEVAPLSTGGERVPETGSKVAPLSLDRFP